jgi:LuxR family quorum sensing-dependent transcriptional regulator
MLAIIENYLRSMNSARSDAEVTRVLGAVARDMGFRSAYLIEYASKLSATQHVLDTDPARRGWWGDYFASDLRPSPREIASTLAGESVHRYDASRFGRGAEQLRAACEAHDVVNVTAVPIGHSGELVGIAGFCGEAGLDRQQETALQLIAYNAFAHIRSARGTASTNSDIVLTPREKQVMHLSAEGLTSSEIAEKLDMSARTVNQHVDNVADKLGTRNRAHTVAEIVRRGLL